MHVLLELCKGGLHMGCSSSPHAPQPTILIAKSHSCFFCLAPEQQALRPGNLGICCSSLPLALGFFWALHVTGEPLQLTH